MKKIVIQYSCCVKGLNMNYFMSYVLLCLNVLKLCESLNWRGLKCMQMLNFLKRNTTSKCHFSLITLEMMIEIYSSC